MADPTGDKANCYRIAIQEPAYLELYDEKGYAPLLAAARYGDEKSVTELLHAGANPNARTRNRYGATALIFAAFLGCSRSVQQLIAFGADVNVGDNNNIAPLHVAAACGHVRIVEDLIEAGADVNVIEIKEGGTPLINAVRNKKHEVMERLILAGASLDLQTKAGEDPWIIAAIDGDAEAIKVLTMCGRANDCPAYLRYPAGGTAPARPYIRPTIKYTKAFLSYAHWNKELVGRLVSDLTEAGVPLWFDKQQLPPEVNGEDLFKQIRAAWEECDVGIFLETPPFLEKVVVPPGVGSPSLSAAFEGGDVDKAREEEGPLPVETSYAFYRTRPGAKTIVAVFTAGETGESYLQRPRLFVFRHPSGGMGMVNMIDRMQDTPLGEVVFIPFKNYAQGLTALLEELDTPLITAPWPQTTG